MSAADAIAVGWNNDSNIHICILQKIFKTPVYIETD